MKVENKTIVVTGGGSGMGRELVLGLLDMGARVIAIDMNPSALVATSILSGNKKDCFTGVVLDITNREAVEENASKLIDQYGFIDGLINNAGIIQPFTWHRR